MTSSLATLNLTGDLTYLAVPVRIATPTSQLEQQQQQQPLLLPPLCEDGYAEASAEAEAAQQQQPPQVLPPPIPPPPSPSSMDAVTQTLAASSEDLAKENLVNEHCDSRRNYVPSTDHFLHITDP